MKEYTIKQEDEVQNDVTDKVNIFKQDNEVFT